MVKNQLVVLQAPHGRHHQSLPEAQCPNFGCLGSLPWILLSVLWEAGQRRKIKQTDNGSILVGLNRRHWRSGIPLLCVDVSHFWTIMSAGEVLEILKLTSGSPFISLLHPANHTLDKQLFFCLPYGHKHLWICATPTIWKCPFLPNLYANTDSQMINAFMELPGTYDEFIFILRNCLLSVQ